MKVILFFGSFSFAYYSTLTVFSILGLLYLILYSVVEYCAIMLCPYLILSRMSSSLIIGPRLDPCILSLYFFQHNADLIAPYLTPIVL